MNERIIQLSKQAADYVNEVYTPPVRSKTPGKIWEDGHVGWHTQFNQKFAELIIRDCMDVVDGYTKPRTFDTHYDAVEQIEALFGIKHFGVEE